MESNLTQKDIVRLRFIFIFIIILSNAITYTSIQPTELSATTNETTLDRLDYVYFKARVKLKTPFTPGGVFTLASLNEKVIIKNVFMEQMEDSPSSIEQVDQSSVKLIMNIHKDDFLKVRHITNLIAYPSGTNLIPSTKKGINYEVSY